MPPHLLRCLAAGPVAKTVLLCAIVAGVPSAKAAEAGISVEKAWIRLIISSRPAAGYFTLDNNGSTQRQLIGAVSPACGTLMLHQTTSADGVDAMAMVKSIPVPAHGSISFSPGGQHLMCMGPAVDLKLGSSIPVTLVFADGGTMTADFVVRGALGP